jgi:hypothetical protein
MSSRSKPSHDVTRVSNVVTISEEATKQRIREEYKEAYAKEPNFRRTGYLR